MHQILCVPDVRNRIGLTPIPLQSHPHPYSSHQSHSDKDLKSCQVIGSNKSNLLRKVDFLLKSSFQVIAFFISLEVGYLVKIVLNFVCKGARKLFLGHHRIMLDWFIFSEYFSHWWFHFIMVTWLYYFPK